jgi:probable F420-dependent oxidoreductase
VRLGVIGLGQKATHGPAETLELVRRAEELGYTSWWAGEHVVLPSPPASTLPMRPTDAILDPLIYLAHVAAITRTMELGTGILILPQRNPVVLAKEVASLDVLSGGRVLLGVGVGWLEPEMTAVGVPMADRGRRTDEYLDAMAALWTQPAPSYQGKYVSFDKVDAHPRPVRPDGPRIMIGGRTPAAFRRAVARGHGWVGIGTVDELDLCLDGLRDAAAEVDRPAHLGRLEINFIPAANPVTPGQARRFAGAGVDRLVLYPLPLEDPAWVARFLEAHADLPHD